ncbi:hypothetical protein [Massilia horti]|uniref:Uncharacterized protein n=1 Tax=Massilia horti TaxID=2562153 RepID=A0A4Y9T629_9BURK|nr:hypothetical protein [Massilia horti]TFW35786.1 hypothetical protein E4O92_01140 [Massilia horti]
MKNVTISAVARDASRLLYSAAAVRRVVLFGLTLALGLPAIIVAFHLLDPAAPLVYIVVPVLAGGLLPVLVGAPGRLVVNTRFDARHMVGTLDQTLGALGYAQAGGGPGAVRYRAGSREEIAVTVRDNSLEIVGPFTTLVALQKHIAC